MVVIGCNFHSGFRKIAIFDNQTGGIQEKKLLHPEQAAEPSAARLPGRSIKLCSLPFSFRPRPTASTSSATICAN